MNFANFRRSAFKVFAVAGALLPALGAWAAPPATEKPGSPNRFVCKGTDVELTYSTTSMTGDAVLTYKGPGMMGVLEQQYRGVNEVRISQSNELGTLINFRGAVVPDLGAQSFALVMPGFNVAVDRAGASAPITFKTLLISTVVHTSFAGPVGVKGALSESTGTPLECEASRVLF